MLGLLCKLQEKVKRVETDRKVAQQMENENEEEEEDKEGEE